MDLGLNDRVYLVTGGTSGLGLATAQTLVDEGARVVVSSRRSRSVDAAVEMLGGQERAAGVVADNADPATPALLIRTATERFGRLDGALVSVGGPPSGTAMDASDEQWQHAFETVFLGAVRLARAVARVVGDSGAIALVLSSSVRSPLSHLAISNGLRPGLAMYAKTLADELGPRGVRVLSLLPGRIDTPRLRSLGVGPSVEDIPLRRLGTPEEFGRVAAFVLSPAASYLTGVVVSVDGGMLRAL
ncbi:MAG: 3-oxoacyl-[acyl-carrier protein] reductase [Frankiales bacterium]|jgi:3-oxoacyl-[acyl-carrier protein] reductase|nr:3-oxoacyl-[acyl-carrier protein] reductase [Frankiales bacterium]